MDDLFGAGFAWDDSDVSHGDATPPATALHAAAAAHDSPRRKGGGGDPLKVHANSHGRVASVAGVANLDAGNAQFAVSQAMSPISATPPATPNLADFCGVEGDPLASVADVASVAAWEDGVRAFGQRRAHSYPQEWRALQDTAKRLLALWGSDLVRCGWSTLQVWGSNRDISHRRLDQLGLVHFAGRGVVEAIDSDAATIRHGKRDLLRFRPSLVATTGVPIWRMGSGASGWEGGRGSAFSATPTNPDLSTDAFLGANGW